MKFFLIVIFLILFLKFEQLIAQTDSLDYSFGIIAGKNYNLALGISDEVKKTPFNLSESGILVDEKFKWTLEFGNLGLFVIKNINPIYDISLGLIYQRLFYNFKFNLIDSSLSLNFSPIIHYLTIMPGIGFKLTDDDFKFNIGTEIGIPIYSTYELSEQQLEYKNSLSDYWRESGHIEEVNLRISIYSGFSKKWYINEKISLEMFLLATYPFFTISEIKLLETVSISTIQLNFILSYNLYKTF